MAMETLARTFFENNFNFLPVFLLELFFVPFFGGGMEGERGRER
jgi:hypothetical protein